MRRPQLARAAALVALAAGGLLLMSRFGDLQLPSVLVYSGIAAFACGLISALFPPRWLGVSRRRHAILAAVPVAAILFTAGWFWPARAFTTPSPATRLDVRMPEYQFHERHELLIHASPDRVRDALNRVSFADIGVMETLGRIRGMVVGGNRAGGGLSARPILETVKGPRSGFFLLDDTPNEFVFGLAGQPWNNVAVRLTSGEFRTWNKPGNVKIAANFLIQDAGNGRSLVVTETRIAGSDASSRSKMAKYWAFIYPGSGMIRRSLLEAIRVRAEQPPPAAVRPGDSPARPHLRA